MHTQLFSPVALCKVENTEQTLHLGAVLILWSLITVVSSQQSLDLVALSYFLYFLSLDQ